MGRPPPPGIAVLNYTPRRKVYLLCVWVCVCVCVLITPSVLQTLSVSLYLCDFYRLPNSPQDSFKAEIKDSMGCKQESWHRVGSQGPGCVTLSHHFPPVLHRVPGLNWYPSPSYQRWIPHIPHSLPLSEPCMRSEEQPLSPRVRLRVFVLEENQFQPLFSTFGVLSLHTNSLH